MKYPNSVLTKSTKGELEVRRLLSKGRFVEYDYIDPKTGKIMKKGKRSIILKSGKKETHYFIIFISVLVSLWLIFINGVYATPSYCYSADSVLDQQQIGLDPTTFAKMGVSDMENQQSFKVSKKGAISKIGLQVSRTGSPSWWNVYIRGSQTGTPLAEGNLNPDSATSDASNPNWVEWTLTTPVDVESGTTYWIGAYANYGYNIFIRWHGNRPGSSYPDGTAGWYKHNTGETFTISDVDLAFKVWLKEPLSCTPGSSTGNNKCWGLACCSGACEGDDGKCYSVGAVCESKDCPADSYYTSAESAEGDQKCFVDEYPDTCDEICSEGICQDCICTSTTKTLQTCGKCWKVDRCDSEAQTCTPYSAGISCGENLICDGAGSCVTCLSGTTKIEGECGWCGQQKWNCNVNNQWVKDECLNQGICNPTKSCCNPTTCMYIPATPKVECDSKTELVCTDSCGGILKEQTFKKFCQGGTAECTGNWEFDSDVDIAFCNPIQRCQLNKETPCVEDITCDTTKPEPDIFEGPEVTSSTRPIFTSSATDQESSIALIEYRYCPYYGGIDTCSDNFLWTAERVQTDFPLPALAVQFNFTPDFSEVSDGVYWVEVKVTNRAGLWTIY